MKGEMNEKLLEVTEDHNDNNKEEISLKNKIWNETKTMWIVAGPAILVRVSMFGINVISQAFVGHIGSTELAAYALVFTVLLRFANSILLGMTSGLGTLCGQAYGAKRYHMLGIYLQQSWIILIITSTIISPIFIFATPILKALGQDVLIAEVAGTIALWFIPVIYSFVISFSCQMYLQAQSKNLIISYLAICSFSIHIFLSWLLTVKYKFGVTGAMVSTILAYWIPNVGQIVYVICGGCRETWNGFTTLAFHDLGPIIKLSLSSGAMICLELWYNTILILLTGNMKNAEVTISALSICLNISGWLMMVSIGFLSAARYGLWTAILVLVGRLAYVFTKSHEVAMAVARLSPLLAFSILLNSVQPVLSGVANGAGWQSIVAYVNVGSYYLIGIPLGAVLGYVVKLHVEGVWIGMLIGTVIQTIVLVIITYRTDWDKQVSLAQNRVNRWFVDVESNNNSSSSNSGAT